MVVLRVLPLYARSPTEPATLEPRVAEERVTAEPDLAIEPSVAKRAQYRTHVPVYDLVAAAGVGEQVGLVDHEKHEEHEKLAQLLFELIGASHDFILKIF